MKGWVVLWRFLHAPPPSDLLSGEAGKAWVNWNCSNPIVAETVRAQHRCSARGISSKLEARNSPARGNGDLSLLQLLSCLTRGLLGQKGWPWHSEEVFHYAWTGRRSYAPWDAWWWPTASWHAGQSKPGGSNFGWCLRLAHTALRTQEQEAAAVPAVVAAGPLPALLFLLAQVPMFFPPSALILFLCLKTLLLIAAEGKKNLLKN